MAAPLPEKPGVPTGKRCFNLDKLFIPLACTVIRTMPEAAQAAVCKSRAIGDAVVRAACLGTLQHLGFPIAGAMLLCNKVVGADACCPGGSPPLDPPVPTDYEAGGMKPPSQYGIPTPLVGGCNCDHSEFEDEVEANLTGNVGAYRP